MLCHRKASRQMIDAWLMTHSVASSSGSASIGVDAEPQLMSASGGGGGCGGSGGVGGGGGVASGVGVIDARSHGPTGKNASSGAATPVRKISAHEFERGGLLRPLVTTIDGALTFIR